MTSIRPEQRTATREVLEVAPGLWRLQLPLRMGGLRHINCYAMPDTQGAALVDTGMPTPWGFRALRNRLEAIGVAPEQVHTIVLTHSHPDHAGGARRLAALSGATVIAHADFEGAVAQAPLGHDEVPLDDLPSELLPVARDSAGDGVNPWDAVLPWEGRGSLFSRLLYSTAVGIQRRLVPGIDRHVVDGDSLTLGGRTWQVLHTPGHTSDHICLRDPDACVMLSGDHVLPSITPHISGRSRLENPLKAYFESLDRVERLHPRGLVMPAHGRPFDALPQRVASVRQHHVERLEQLFAIVQRRGGTVRAHSRRLFARHAWGMMAASETHAHLEYLRQQGRVVRTSEPSGRPIYSPP